MPLPRHLQNQRPELRLVPPPPKLKPIEDHDRAAWALVAVLLLGVAGFVAAALWLSGGAS
jgi:hypothetical protein